MPTSDIIIYILQIHKIMSLEGINIKFLELKFKRIFVMIRVFDDAEYEYHC